MSHFAYIDDNNLVTQVIVVEQDQIDTGFFGDPARWIQTSYNTHGGQHLSGGTPLRKNFAGVGFTYDAVRDAFVAPQPYPSWLLNEQTCQWVPPVPEPAAPDNPRFGYVWSESDLNWQLHNLFTGLPHQGPVPEWGDSGEQ